MSGIMRTRLGASASAIVNAGLVASSGPAVAKVTMACKQQLHVGAGSLGAQSEAAAKAVAIAKWKAQVGNKYGDPWTKFSNAKAVHYDCMEIKGGWVCAIWAAPCAPVKPPSASKAQPEPPSTRTTTELDRLPEPSDPETRTVSPARRTGTTDQPGATTRLPSAGAGPGRTTPAPSSPIAGPRD